MNRLIIGDIITNSWSNDRFGFNLADMGSKVRELDKWLRRRLRLCIWKSWKKSRTRVKNLIRCGIERWQAYQWGNTSKGYWRIAGSGILDRAIGDDALHKAGYSWIGCYYSASALPKGSCSGKRPEVERRNRRMRNRLYGGVRGQVNTKGGKHL